MLQLQSRPALTCLIWRPWTARRTRQPRRAQQLLQGLGGGLRVLTPRMRRRLPQRAPAIACPVARARRAGARRRHQGCCLRTLAHPGARLCRRCTTSHAPLHDARCRVCVHLARARGCCGYWDVCRPARPAQGQTVRLGRPARTRRDGGARERPARRGDGRRARIPGDPAVALGGRAAGRARLARARRGRAPVPAALGCCGGRARRPCAARGAAAWSLQAR
jgi:hypothetical protein